MVNLSPEQIEELMAQAEKSKGTIEELRRRMEVLKLRSIEDSQRASKWEKVAGEEQEKVVMLQWALDKQTGDEETKPTAPLWPHLSQLHQEAEAVPETNLHAFPIAGWKSYIRASRPVSTSATVAPLSSALPVSI